MWTTPRTRVTTTLMPLVTLHGRTYFLDMSKISKSENWVIFQDDFAPLRIIILLFGAIDFWHLEKAAVESCNYKLLMFFFNLEIFRSSLLQQSPSNLRCYSGVLPLVVPVAPFHQLKHDEMRGWICLVLQCWVIFVSWLNQKISVGWNVRPEFFEKGNPDVSASMNISCQKLPDQAL